MTRWPSRRPPSQPEPPEWFRVFVVEDWARPGDDEVRYPAGALMGAEVVARRRWADACRLWARATPGFSVAEWIAVRRAARRAGFVRRDGES